MVRGQPVDAAGRWSRGGRSGKHGWRWSSPRRSPCRVGMKACAGRTSGCGNWRRPAMKCGRSRRPVASHGLPRGGSDGETGRGRESPSNGAEAICTGAARPTKRRVAVDTAMRQTSAMGHRARDVPVCQSSWPASAIHDRPARVGPGGPRLGRDRHLERCVRDGPPPSPRVVAKEGTKRGRPGARGATRLPGARMPLDRRVRNALYLVVSRSWWRFACGVGCSCSAGSP